MSNRKKEKTASGFLKHREIHGLDFAMCSVVFFINRAIFNLLGEIKIQLIEGFSAEILNEYPLGENATVDLYIRIRPFPWEKGDSFVIRLLKMSGDVHDWYLSYIHFESIKKSQDDIFITELPSNILFSEHLIKKCQNFLLKSFAKE
ncbi:MAG: hypothetical protein WC849_01555 [Candidatus Paceibacterota bacterium]